MYMLKKKKSKKSTLPGKKIIIIIGKIVLVFDFFVCLLSGGFISFFFSRPAAGVGCSGPREELASWGKAPCFDADVMGRAHFFLFFFSAAKDRRSH